MSKTVKKELLNKAISYIEQNYSLIDRLDELGYLKECEKQEDGRLSISCPFHDDKTPSFKIIGERNYYRCFSCGSHGGILDFEFQYRKEILGQNISFRALVEEYVKRDQVLQLKIGAKSLFETETYDISGISSKRFLKSRTLKLDNTPKTFLELSKEIQSRTDDDRVILKAISLMEMGMNPSEIYRFLESSLNKKNEVQKDQISFDDILNGDEFK
jgi:DNA primase